MSLLLALLLSQNPAQVIIVDPSTRPATPTGSTAAPVKVTCVSGCTSGGSTAPTIVTVDGGSLYVVQPNASALNATVTGTVAATGPVTNSELRAAPVIMTVDGGTIYVTQPNASALNATVTGTVAATQSGTWTDTPRTVASANNSGTCVSVTTSSTNVLASNSSRRGYAFKASPANTALVHCKLGATATTSNVPFEAGASWSQDTGAVYTGAVDCIAASGTQSVCPYEVN